MSVIALRAFGNEMVTFTPKSHGHRMRLVAALQEIAGSPPNGSLLKPFWRALPRNLAPLDHSGDPGSAGP